MYPSLRAELPYRAMIVENPLGGKYVTSLIETLLHLCDNDMDSIIHVEVHEINEGVVERRRREGYCKRTAPTLSNITVSLFQVLWNRKLPPLGHLSL